MTTALESRQNTLEVLARAGYAARGLVYILVGGLAFMAAIGAGGQTGGSTSALATLVDEPFGRVILGLIAVGVLGFGIWCFVQSLWDADRRGRSWKGLAIRTGQFVSGFVYLGLALTAAGLALGTSGSANEESGAQGWTAWLMSQPFGYWLVIAVGVAIIGVGIGFLYKGWKGEVLEFLRMDSGKKRWAEPLGRLGFAARGIVFMIVGGFLVVAALSGNAGQVRLLGGALRALQEQPYGWVLLLVVAAGLVAFGVFGLIQALYRHIDTPDIDGARRAAAAKVRGHT